MIGKGRGLLVSGAVVLAGVAAGAWLRGRAERTAHGEELRELRRDVGRLDGTTDEIERQLGQLHSLAASETVVYLRGFMDGGMAAGDDPTGRG